MIEKITLLKKGAWAPLLLFVLMSPYLLAQTTEIPNSLENEMNSGFSSKPTDELIDISNIKLDQELIYGPTPWTLPEEYRRFLNSDYRRAFFRMTGIEYSGLHWKQFVMVYMNIRPEIYVKNYYEYVRLYYSDSDDDWGGNEGTEDDDKDGGHEVWDNEEEDWDDIDYNDDQDDDWDDTEGDDDKGWNETKADMSGEDSIPKFELFLPGTILLKEHYKNEDGQPGAPETITLMIKREEGYDPNAGDWEYSQFDTNGKILMEGRSRRAKIYQSCVECHANIKERDYVFTTYSSWLPNFKNEE